MEQSKEVEKVNLELDLQSINVILEALNQVPYGAAAPVINSIHIQYSKYQAAKQEELGSVIEPETKMDVAE